MKKAIASIALVAGLVALAPASAQAASGGDNGKHHAYGKVYKHNKKHPKLMGVFIRTYTGTPIGDSRRAPGISPVYSTYTRSNTGSLTDPTPAGHGTCVLMRVYGDMGLYKCTTSGSLIARYYWLLLP